MGIRSVNLDLKVDRSRVIGAYEIHFRWIESDEVVADNSMDGFRLAGNRRMAPGRIEINGIFRKAKGTDGGDNFPTRSRRIGEPKRLSCYVMVLMLMLCWHRRCGIPTARGVRRPPGALALSLILLQMQHTHKHTHTETRRERKKDRDRERERCTTRLNTKRGDEYK